MFQARSIYVHVPSQEHLCACPKLGAFMCMSQSRSIYVHVSSRSMYVHVPSQEHLCACPKLGVFSWVRVAQSFVFCVVFCKSLFAISYFLSIILSVLPRLTASLYLFGILTFLVNSSFFLLAIIFSVVPRLTASLYLFSILTFLVNSSFFPLSIIFSVLPRLMASLVSSNFSCKCLNAKNQVS